MTRATRLIRFLSFCSMLSGGIYGQKKGLQVFKQWNQLDWDYASDALRQQAINSGEFITGNGVPLDMDVHYGDKGINKVFVTVPRFIDGIPGTLNTIRIIDGNDNPKLQPYPSWEWHSKISPCEINRMISVFRTQIDECGRLWVLDTGRIGTKQLCNPKIIAFDTITDEVLYRFEIPKDQIVQTSQLITPVVDVRDPQKGCKDTFVYAADVTGFGIIVLDTRRHTSWRIRNQLFLPHTEFESFTIANETFHLKDGIFGMALSPLKPGQDRVLYFHALSGNTENYVYTSMLRNETIFDENPDADSRQFFVFPKKRSSQVPAKAIDRNGVMYFGLTHEITMNCWNIDTDFDEKNFDTIDNNQTTLQFTSGVKVINNRKGGQELWVMTNRFQKVWTGSINVSEINFRIQSASTYDLLRGTKCKKP